jgi:hypothetical protein
VKEDNISKATVIQKLLESLVQQNPKYKENTEGILYLKLLRNKLLEGRDKECQ